MKLSEVLTRRCCAVRCDEPIPEGRLMCLDHWKLLSYRQRQHMRAAMDRCDAKWEAPALRQVVYERRCSVLQVACVMGYMSQVRAKAIQEAYAAILKTAFRFGGVLRVARRSCVPAVTLEEFAGSLGIHVSVLADIECGLRAPPEDVVIRRMAALLVTDADEMVLRAWVDRIEVDFEAAAHVALERDWLHHSMSAGLVTFEEGVTPPDRCDLNGEDGSRCVLTGGHYLSVGLACKGEDAWSMGVLAGVLGGRET